MFAVLDRVCEWLKSFGQLAKIREDDVCINLFALSGFSASVSAALVSRPDEPK